MLTDPMLQLAFSVRNNPGVFALLLGSGVSRAAGMPTGWEVVTDLIWQIMAARGLEKSEDPYLWFAEEYQREPTYDELIQALGQRPLERNALLRGYFEPTDEEREQGIKMPTAAHRAIAWLIKQGYIKVVLTTNFDRLLELALEEIGVRPHVVSTEDQLLGMRPLQHSGCTIIKLHGDYLDGNFKNTPEELAEYSDEMNQFLARVFDEYGLIVCGWSGDWDTALRTAIERTTQRRYSMYWCSYQGPSESAKGVIAHREAQEIRGTSADEFFSELKQNVEALEKFNRQNSISVAVAVERVKKMIPREELRIDLEEFVRAEIERAYRAFTDEAFIAKRTVIIQQNHSPNQRLEEIWKSYFGAVEIVLHIMATLAWYGEEHHAALFAEAVARWTENPPEFDERQIVWRSLPVILLIYVCGIAASNRGNWCFLKALLVDPQVREKHANRPVPIVDIIGEVMKEFRYQTPGGELTAIEQVFYRWCRPILQFQLPAEDQYDFAFDLFDIILALTYLVYNSEGKQSWFPTFSVVSNSRSWKKISSFWREGGRQALNWKLLTCGLFDGSARRLQETVQTYVSVTQEHQQGTRMGLVPDFARDYFDTTPIS
ncbi:MAG: SIR2 family protein [Anaerolineae bacterium]|nr:SIR2 family protein [Anaerolineae bacterium]